MWYRYIDKHVEFSVFVKANAKRTALITINDTQGMVITLHAKPHEGEAKCELINFLAKILDVPKSHIFLRVGIRSKHKRVMVPLTIRVKQFIENPLNFVSVNRKNIF